MDDIEVDFLCQGCQTAEQVAGYIGEFCKRATKTIDIAIYSFCLEEGSKSILQAALKDRADAGVAVRIAYDAGTQLSHMANPGHYDCEGDTGNFIKSLGFPSEAIEGQRVLMHDKYVIVDAGMPGARVLTGSTNWTDESWTLQENNIIVLHSQELADYFTNDFNELWRDGNVETTGIKDSGEATLQYEGQPAYVLVNFAPGEGEWIDELIANQLERTEQRLTLASVVITSTRIIKALQSLMQRNIPIEGLYDWTQMEGVKYQWQMVPANNWKIGAFEEIVKYCNLVGKKSTPYSPTSTHDFMHNKVLVPDDVTITGSYNFSRHAQANAENMLLIKSPPFAETYRKYIHDMMEKYRKQPAPPSSPNPTVQQAETATPAPNT